MKKIHGENLDIRLGLPGSGKTLCLTEHVVLPALLDGLDVYINYWINWNEPNIHYFQDFEDILTVRNCVVIMDEIGGILEPRNWDSETSNIRKFFQLHRHRHVDIHGTTQHVSLIAKTALIEIKNFYMCMKVYDGWLLKAMFNDLPYVAINEQEMTLKEIKALDTEFMFNKNEDETDFTLSGSETHFFSKKRLYHRELNEFKEELIHMYCPKCEMRQGEKIPKKDTIKFGIFTPKNYQFIPNENIKLPNCPKHKKQKLILRESTMYDTDYEFPVEEKDIVFKPYIKTVRETPFRGTLSDSQLQHKKNLEKGVDK